MAASISNDDEPIAAINVTPLVDVVLVLLVIFMITAPFIYQSAIHVVLPRAVTGEQSKASSLQFTITKEGRVSWNNEWIEWASLESRLQDHKAIGDDASAVINADESTPHGLVIRLMDLLKQIGVSKFGLTVDSKSSSLRSG